MGGGGGGATARLVSAGRAEAEAVGFSEASGAAGALEGSPVGVAVTWAEVATVALAVTWAEVATVALAAGGAGLLMLRGGGSVKMIHTEPISGGSSTTSAFLGPDASSQRALSQPIAVVAADAGGAAP